MWNMVSNATQNTVYWHYAPSSRLSPNCIAKNKIIHVGYISLPHMYSSDIRYVYYHITSLFTLEGAALFGLVQILVSSIVILGDCMHWGQTPFNWGFFQRYGRYPTHTQWIEKIHKAVTASSLDSWIDHGVRRAVIISTTGVHKPHPDRELQTI